MENDLNLQLKTLISKAAAILQSYSAIEVYAFGSATNERFGENSDIDLAVRGIPPNKFFSAVGEALCSLDRNLDIIDLDAETAFGKYLEDHGDLVRVL
jgi:predicted nucleotidyltransferase